MKLLAKVGTHSSGMIVVDGRSLGKKPICVGKHIRIKYMSDKWQMAVVDKFLVESNLYFLTLL